MEIDMPITKRAKVDLTRVKKEQLQLLFSEQRRHGYRLRDHTLDAPEMRRYMNYFFDKLQYGPIEELCQVMLDCKGSIFFTGVGKSGFIAQKLSQILVSTGTKATFLSPTDALHGDIGIVGHNDLLLAFSKSGSTEELMKLIPFAKAKGAQVVAVTCIPGSRMEDISDLTIILPLERELCPFDLAPVTSTAIQMLFGDTIAIALMQAINLTKEQYAMNHPAGRIGKRLMLNVDAIMLTNGAVPIVSKDTTVVDALPSLSSRGCGCVLVVEGTLLLGTFTDGDLRRAVQTSGGSGLHRPISELMTLNPRTIRSNAKAVDAMHAMESPTRVTFLPVVDDGELKGVVTLHHLVEAGL